MKSLLLKNAISLFLPLLFLENHYCFQINPILRSRPKTKFHLHTGTLFELQKHSKDPSKSQKFSDFSFDQIMDTASPETINLDDILYKTFDESEIKRCLVHVTNFKRDQDIMSKSKLMTIPLILFTPKPALLINLRKQLESILMVPSGVSFQQKITAGDNCTFSSFLNGLDDHDIAGRFGYCIRLKFYSFALAHRPWSCVVQVKLLIPPSVILGTTMNGRGMLRNDYVLTGSVFSYQLPISQGDRRIDRDLAIHLGMTLTSHDSQKYFDIIVAPKTNMLNRKYTADVIKAWYQSKIAAFQHVVDLAYSRIYSETLVLIEVEKYSGNVSHAHHVSLCGIHCLSGFQLVRLSSDFTLKNSLLLFAKKPINLKVMTHSSSLFWKTDKYFCEHPSNGKANVIHSSPEKALLLQGYISVWTSIFQNFTVSSNKGNGYKYRCSLGTPGLNIDSMEGMHSSLELVAVSNSYEHYPLLLEDPSSSLKFLSCSKPRWSSMAFGELVSIFDMYIWVGILAVVFLTISSVLIILGGKNYNVMTLSGTFMHPLRAFLEQSPFTDSQMKATHMRYIIGPFLLMMVILSNAYKNDNVYNIVIPRKEIPYEKFDELIKEGFKIFTRIMDLEGPQRIIKGDFCGEILEEPHKILGHLHTGRFRHKNVLQNCSTLIYVIYSEIWSKTRNEHERGERQNKLQHQNKLQRQIRIENLRNFTQIIPGYTKQWIEEAVLDFKNGNGRWKENFLRKQDKGLSAKLKTCDRTAIILSELECYRKASILGGHESRKLSVGKEDLFKQKIGFYFEGWLPHNLNRKMSAMTEAGVWGWWADFARESAKVSISQELSQNTTTSTFEDAKLITPTMSGNILIIFVILGAGLCIAFIGFLAEWFIVQICFIFIKYFIMLASMQLGLIIQFTRKTSAVFRYRKRCNW